VSAIHRLFEFTAVYRAWQAPFAERKFVPVRRHNDLSRVRRVLDVGCGPGTNTHWFAANDYLGVDINPAYIADAQRRTGRSFLVADVTTYEVDPAERFDFIFLNSLLHHIDTASVRRLLAHLATLLTDDGYVHILDLVRPATPSIGRTLADWDRGQYPRPLAEWESLFGEAFQPVLVEPYPLGAAGLTLWNMLYFKGRRRDVRRSAG
jgi:SAM-dependent methyltransferase